jgi:uncharacterized protein involved in exopolysaccharide biosynthesis
LVQIRVVDEDKELAAEVANKMAESYQDFRRSRGEHVAMEDFAALKNAAAVAEENVSHGQVQLNDLRKQLGISDSADGPGQSEPASVERERANALAQILESAQAEYVLFNTKLQGLQKFDRKTLRAVAPTVVSGEQLLPQLLADLNNAEQKLAQLRTDSADGAPEVVRAEALRQRIDSQIEARLDGILMGLASQVAALKARRDTLQKELDEARVVAIEQPARERAYRALRRDLEIDEKMHDALVLQMRQADLGVRRRDTGVQIVVPAMPELRPVSPNRPLAGALSMSGLVLIFAGISLRRRGPAVGLPAAG